MHIVSTRCGCRLISCQSTLLSGKKVFAYLEMNFHQTRGDCVTISGLRRAINCWREALLSSWQPQSEWNDNGQALYLLLLDVHVALLWPIKGVIRFVSSHPWAGANVGNSDLKLCSGFQMMIIAVCDTAAVAAGGICTVWSINAFIIKLWKELTMQITYCCITLVGTFHWFSFLILFLLERKKDRYRRGSGGFHADG